MIKYILLLISIFLNLSYTKAQSSNNASGNDIYNNYGSIAHSVGEVYRDVEEIQNYQIIKIN